MSGRRKPTSSLPKFESWIISAWSDSHLRPHPGIRGSTGRARTPPASDGLECPPSEAQIFVLDNLAHAHLRQLLGHEFLSKQTALKGGLVLNEGGDPLVQNPPAIGWKSTLLLPEWLSS